MQMQKEKFKTYFIISSTYFFFLFYKLKNFEIMFSLNYSAIHLERFRLETKWNSDTFSSGIMNILNLEKPKLHQVTNWFTLLKSIKKGKYYIICDPKQGNLIKV